MNQIVKDALSLWGMESADFKLVAVRENAVFRADHNGKSYAVRLHRRGYRTDAELKSELVWMDAAARGGITVPAPIESKAGAFLHLVHGTQVDVLTWLSGKPLSALEGLQGEAECTDVFFKLGREMARLHDISDSWSMPTDFRRVQWDRDGLVGGTPLWGRFWENPGLSDDDRELFSKLRIAAQSELKKLEESLDYGLVHADLVSANVLIQEGQVALIDFDDGGFGFRLFDIATALLKHMSRPDYSALQSALIAGYLSIRKIDVSALDLFFVLRAATYVGWVITRMEEDGAVERNIRFINVTRDLARAYLDGSQTRLYR